MQRGPLVYCMEGVDNGNIGLDRISLDAGDVERFSVEHRRDLLGGVTVLHGVGRLIEENGWDQQTLYRRQGHRRRKRSIFWPFPMPPGTTALLGRCGFGSGPIENEVVMSDIKKGGGNDIASPLFCYPERAILLRR